MSAQFPLQIHHFREIIEEQPSGAVGASPPNPTYARTATTPGKAYHRLSRVSRVARILNVMGKVTTKKYDSVEYHERIKKRKRKKDLEEIRRNALAAKRNVQNRQPPTDSQKSKSSFIKTLNEFASRRADIESVIQSQDSLLSRSTFIDEHNEPKLFKTKGFFLGGIKGKQLTRPSDTLLKVKEAVLNNDALKLLQSGNYGKQEEYKKQTVENDVEKQIKKNIAKIFEDSSESCCTDDDLRPITQLVQSSPILGGIKRKVNLVKLDANGKVKKFSSQNNQSSVINPYAKEEKCKRRLFEDENTSVNNKNIEYANNNLIRLSPRKSTPENVIFFTDQIPYKDFDNRVDKKHSNNKINPTNSHVIKCYIHICKMIAEKEFKNLFSTNIKDPMETTKAALRDTYNNTFKEYLHRQKSTACDRRSHSTDRTTTSSNSETMLEPDSAVARIVKKNAAFQMKDAAWYYVDNNSDQSVHNVDDTDIELCTSLLTVKNKMKAKRDYLSRAEHSDTEIPSSTKVNADPESARMELKMDCVHPDKQELVARYLKDIDTNSKHEIDINIFNDERNIAQEYNNQQPEKEKLFVNDNIKNNYLAHKSSRHIPAILRKNRALVDNITKEKILLSMEKYQKIGEVMNKPAMLDFTSDNRLKSERTPNFGNTLSNQTIEAPKCRYMYMNAKYNQPSRIGVPMIQNRKFQNVPSDRHLFSSPANGKKQFIISQGFELSPIKEQLHYAGNKQDYHRCQISQESSEQDNNCMTRITSFGDIQERANRLTLCSSQSQNCSQESIEPVYSSQEERYNLPPDFYYQQRDRPKNHLTFNNGPCMAYNEKPTSKAFDAANYKFHPNNTIKYKEQPGRIVENDFEIVPAKEYAFQKSESIDCCLANDCQACRKHQNQQHNQIALINSMPMQQPSACQPVKFIAVEENQMPQRRPIYNSTDSNPCPFIHKTSISNHQFTRVMKPCYTRDISNQQPCSSSIQFYPQKESIIGPKFQYDNIHKVNGIIPSSSQKLNNEVSRLNRKSVNFAPTQTFIAEHGVPVHAAMNNQKCMGHHIQPQMPSSLYSPVGYQHNHCTSNKDYIINDDYAQQMNRFIRTKRP